MFRYTREALEHWTAQQVQAGAPFPPPHFLPYEDYQVARYWEDLLEMLPDILDPIPDDFAARVADAEGWRAWQDRAQSWHEEQEQEDEGGAPSGVQA